MSSQIPQQTVQILAAPQLLVDGNQNPLLKIDGNSATIWQYTLATLSSLNHSIVGQSKNRYEVTVKVDQQIYVLRLTSVGSSNNIAVFNADNSFADQEKAADLLSPDLPKLASLVVLGIFFEKGSLMLKQTLLYTGKAKSVYETDSADHLILVFRDDASAFNGGKN